MRRRRPIPTLFPYTTLFRSAQRRDQLAHLLGLEQLGGVDRVGTTLHQTEVLDARILQHVPGLRPLGQHRSEEHTSELQSLRHLVCRLLLEKKKKISHINYI